WKRQKGDPTLVGREGAFFRFSHPRRTRPERGGQPGARLRVSSISAGCAQRAAVAGRPADRAAAPPAPDLVLPARAPAGAGHEGAVVARLVAGRIRDRKSGG